MDATGGQGGQGFGCLVCLHGQGTPGASIRTGIQLEERVTHQVAVSSEPSLRRGSLSKGEISDQFRWRKAQVTGRFALGIFERGVFPHREEVWVPGLVAGRVRRRVRVGRA